MAILNEKLQISLQFPASLHFTSTWIYIATLDTFGMNIIILYSFRVFSGLEYKYTKKN